MKIYLLGPGKSHNNLKTKITMILKLISSKSNFLITQPIKKTDIFSNYMFNNFVLLVKV